MANAPRPGASRRAAIADSALSFKVHGKTYTFRLGELSGTLTRDCRQTTGYTPMQILSNMSGSEFTADLDVLAAFMWLCDHQAGGDVDFEELLGEATYEWLASFESTEEHDEGDPDSPEA